MVGDFQGMWYIYIQNIYILYLFFYLYIYICMYVYISQKILLTQNFPFKCCKPYPWTEWFWTKSNDKVDEQHHIRSVSLCKWYCKDLRSPFHASCFPKLVSIISSSEWMHYRLYNILLGPGILQSPHLKQNSWITGWSVETFGGPWRFRYCWF